MHDVIIIGGSYTGLAAGMSLGRAIRKVLIIDSGNPCNKQTPHSHNFITHDGETPAAIAAKAKEQVLKYPTVQFKNDKVTEVTGENNNFTVTTANGETFKTKKILFATGITDIIPAIEGYTECWGISAIHCPYCHGYEYKGQTTGILINGEMAMEFGTLISNWTDKLTIYTNGKSTIPENNFNIVEKEIKKLHHTNGYIEQIEFADGSKEPLDALYSRLPFKQHTPIPEILGCKLNAQGFIEVDDFKKTTVPGLFAAGDNSSPMRSVAGSVAAGTMAGASIVRELVTFV
jgi:thioredoxin reductase